jgi:hypothetical protein
MASTDELSRTSGEVKCSYHPSVMTRLRCSRCGKPICPRCGVRTPVGLRCPDCAGVRGLPTYRTTSDTLAKAAAIGVGVALVVGVVFGVAESMAWASKGKRGTDLQVVGMAAVALGLVIGRVILANRLGISWEEVNQFGRVIVDGRLVPVEDALYLRLLPDAVFAALAFAIVWYRFR